MLEIRMLSGLFLIWSCYSMPDQSVNLTFDKRKEKLTI